MFASHNSSIFFHILSQLFCSISSLFILVFVLIMHLDYSNLNQVHHGEEAIDAYKKLKTLTGIERDELRENMLKYCCLDTKSMVVVYLRLLDLIAHHQKSIFEL